jgi:type I restriction enzyme S subunit
MRFNYPTDWHLRPIAELVVPTEQRNPQLAPASHFKYVDVSSVSNSLFKVIGFSNLLGKDAPSRARKVIKTNDVIFATVRPTLKRIAIISKELNNEICSTGYCVLRCSPEKILPEFLYYSLMTQSFTQRMESIQKGVSYPAVSDTEIKKSVIAVPNFIEQRTIVYILSTIQQAVLKQDKLIRAATALKGSLLHSLITEGTKNEPSMSTEIGPVPEGWIVSELAPLLKTAQYGISTKGQKDGRIPILRMTNQVDGKIDGRKEKLQYVEINNALLEKFGCKKGDIIFNRTNSLDLVGKTSLFELEGEFVFASYLIRLQTKANKLLPEYLNALFNLDQTQSRLKLLASRGVSQCNISASRLKTFKIPVPPLEEQRYIAIVDEALSKKIYQHKIQKATYVDLFNGLLNELMTGTLRVNRINLDNLIEQRNTKREPQIVY